LRLFIESPDEVLTALEDFDAVRAFTHPAIQAAIDAGLEALRSGSPFDAPRALEVASGLADEATIAVLRRTMLDPPPAKDDVRILAKRLLKTRIETTLQRLAKETDSNVSEELAKEANRLNKILGSLT
jgi:hypothetical protein